MTHSPRVFSAWSPKDVTGCCGPERAHRVGDVHQHVGAVDRQAALARRGHVLLVHDRRQRPLARLAALWLVGRLRHLAPRLDDDRLQLFAPPTHRCRPARTRGRSRSSRRRTGTMFSPAWPIAMTLRSFSPYRSLRGDGVVDALAPDVARRRAARRCRPRRRRRSASRPAAEHQPVEAGPAQPRRRPAALMAVGDGAGQRRLGDDRHPAAHVRLGAGERAVHEAEQVVGRERIDRRTVLEHVADAQPARADVLARPLLGNWCVPKSNRSSGRCGQPCPHSRRELMTSSAAIEIAERQYRASQAAER